MRTACLLLLLAPAARASDDLHNTAMYVNPAEKETPSKGEFVVHHAGEGDLPEKGYFKEHEPGEIAEFHVFVPW